MIRSLVDATELEAMATALEASEAYRVLRLLKARKSVTPSHGTETRVGLLLDVETTGLDPARDEVIELAMVPFVYGLDGTIYEIREAFQKLRQPSKPIPPEITELTGISDTMVAGQSITSQEVDDFVNGVALVVAHNAAFDRQFAERLSAGFISKPWACSMSQIDWKAEGFEGTKLPYLAMGAGFFYNRHRAAHDCLATIELLARPLPKSGHLAMARLLEQARRPSWRVVSPGVV